MLKDFSDYPRNLHEDHLREFDEGKVIFSYSRYFLFPIPFFLFLSFSTNLEDTFWVYHVFSASDRPEIRDMSYSGETEALFLV